MSSISATTEKSVGAGVDHASKAARANLCYLLSRAFAPPSETSDEDIERLSQLIPALPERLRSHTVDLLAKWRRGLADEEEMLAAWTRLFLGPFEVFAPPYASFYLEEDRQLMGRVSNMVAEHYATAGLEPGPGPREAPDHVALEWEFVYFLTHKYTSTGHHRWCQQRRRFVSGHLLKWMPELADAMRSAEQHEFYDALAEVLSLVLEECVHW